MKKKQTIEKFLTKKYITTTLLLLFSYTLIGFLTQLFFSGTNHVVANICAKNIVKADYQTIDTSTLEDIYGWLEILDDQNNVIFTKGHVTEKNSHYTQNQLLEMDAFQGIIQQKVYRLGVLTIKVGENNSPYLATYAPFTGDDNKHYTAVTKIPESSLRGNININFSRLNTQTALDVLKWAPLYIGLLLLVFIVFTKRYSTSVKKHVIAPNNILVDGFRAIRNGDYAKEISLNADNEYTEIEESFNHMAKELANAQKERLLYEKERQLLFANMAHDLRTPITTIKGSAKAVADGLISEDDLSQTMATIISKTDHMNDLISRLLIFAKLESTDYPLHFQQVDLAEMTRESTLDHLDLAEKKKINFHLNLPDCPVFITGDTTELRRVLDNLINNSIQHNPPETLVEIAISDFDNSVNFEISDNGEAISKDIQDRLFEPFVSGDTSRSSKTGSGLGLAISRKIIEKHQGTIQFFETKDNRKMFRMILPKR